MSEDTILRHAKVEVIVPEHLGSSNNTPQRTSLFLDEVIDVQLVLRTAASEDTIRAQLFKLSILLEAHAAGSVHFDGQVSTSKQATDLVLTCSLDASGGLIEAAGRSHQTTVTWSTKVHVDRTRISSPSPTLTLTTTLTLALPSTSAEPDSETDDEYLAPGVPTSSANLLISLAQSTAFANNPNPPSLPASRLLRTVPARPRSIKSQLPQSTSGSSTPFKLLPAITSKLRTFGIGTRVLASLEVEVSGHVQEATISDVIVELEHGEALPQGSHAEDRSPRKLRGGDVASLVYNMQPSQGHGRGNDFVDRVDSNLEPHRVKMSLAANVTISRLTVNISSKWQTPVDIASLLQPSTRANAISSTSDQELPHLITLTTSRHPAIRHPTPQGSAIRWQLLLANRSTTQTLNLAIIPITLSANPTAPRDFSGNSDQTVAPVVTAERSKTVSRLPAWLYASTELHNKAESASVSIHGGLPLPSPPLLTLTPLIQLGQLPPGTSTTAEAVFLVLGGAGRVRAIEALRIIDLESRPKDGKGRWSWVDVKSDMLPDVTIAET